MKTHPGISDYFKGISGFKIQKIAVNAGLSCPNRDGKLSHGGCIYCNNSSFNPAYADKGKGSITSQIRDGIEFFKKSGKEYRYLAYFQAYSNTYGETSRLISLYEEALAYPDVIGLVIATRPDCIADDLLEYFRKRFGNLAPENHPHLLVEIGVESTNDSTLKLINRGHDYACVERCIKRLDEAGIDVGVHLIIGLPGEDEHDFINHVERVSKLGIKTIKLHQLQVIKGTKLAEEYSKNPSCVRLYSAEQYARIVIRLLDHIREDIAIDRFVSETPKSMLIAPAWGLKPMEFQNLLERTSRAEKEAPTENQL